MRALHAYSVLLVSALLLIASVAFFAEAQEEKSDTGTDEPILVMFRKSPNAIPLENRGGARTRVDEVEVLDLRSAKRTEDGFLVELTGPSPDP